MFTVYKRMFWFFKKEKKSYISMMILLFLLAIMLLVQPILLGNFIDLIINGKLNNNNFILIAIIFVLTPIIRYFLDYFFSLLINKKGLQLSFELRTNYLKKLFSLDSKYFEKYTNGDLMSRVTRDMESLSIAATSLLEAMFFHITIIIAVILTMSLTISLKLTFISVSILPISFFLLNKIRNHLRKYYKIHREIYGAMSEDVLESIEGVKVVRAYGNEVKDTLKLEKSMTADIESWRYIVKFETLMGPFFDFFSNLPYFFCFAFGINMVLNSEISLGSLLTFSMLIGYLIEPINAMTNVFNGLNNAAISASRYYEIMDEVSEIEVLNQERINSFQKIEFKDVSFKYPFDENKVLNNINLVINAGETIGICGPTGSGKTTLIRQLLREFNIQSGSLLVDNINISSLEIESLRNLVGVVPQTHTLFKDSVVENILIGSKDISTHDFEKAILIADFEKDLHFLNEGLESKVSEGGTNLSGGQKQRLSIARAVVKNPEILILDDSLSAVDVKTENTIIQHLKKYRSDKTNIIVAHRFSAIKNADKIVVMNKGTIAQIGTHGELLSVDGWYKDQYLDQQVEVSHD